MTGSSSAKPSLPACSRAPSKRRPVATTSRTPLSRSSFMAARVRPEISRSRRKTVPSRSKAPSSKARPFFSPSLATIGDATSRVPSAPGFRTLALAPRARWYRSGRLASTIARWRRRWATPGSDGRRSSRARGGPARDLLADSGSDLGAEQLYGPHDPIVRQRADADLGYKALVAEELVLEEDLLHDLLGAPDEERAARRAPRLELGAAHRRPAALAADPVHHLGGGWGVLVARLLRCLGHVGVRVDADRELLGVVAGLARGLAVEPGEGREALGLAADDRDRQRQAKHRGADHRLRRPADGDPDRQRVLDRARVDAGIVERRAVGARPRNALGLAQPQQQLQLLGEQLVVVAEVVAEQRERLDKRAAAGHDLGSPAREEVELVLWTPPS